MGRSLVFNFDDKPEAAEIDYLVFHAVDTYQLFVRLNYVSRLVRRVVLVRNV